MISEVQIHELKSDKVSLYKNFFIQGLIDDEDHFRISPDDERKEPFPTLGTPDSFTLGAYIDNQLCGILSFERDGKTREKQRHKGTLFRMYVSPNFRGSGIARKLIVELLERVKRLQNIEQINLTVVSDNQRAKHLYSSFGFTVFSTEKNAFKWKGRYFSEDQMVLFLD